MCDKTLVCPLKLFFKASFQEGIFPDCWKKANVVPIHKKESKFLTKLQTNQGKYTEGSFLKNYLIISIKIIFLQISISQLLSIVHEINLFFYYDPTIDVSAVFLDISKAFDKVQHREFHLNEKTYGDNGKMMTLLTNYLPERYQRVVLNGQTSSWELV